MKQEAYASPALDPTARRAEICAVFGETYDPARWGDWRWQMRRRLSRLDQFETLFRLTESERPGRLLPSEQFSVAVAPHSASLIDPADASCPLRLQVLPTDKELLVSRGDMADPCGEDGASGAGGAGGAGPVRLQVRPTDKELLVSRGDMADPCGEDGASVVEGLVHRYPDRVLFLVLDTCAAYCRYCTRSRLVSQGELEPLGRRIEAARPP